MSDMSPEAVVAAEAAAAAVEELHEREVVAEAAIDAAIESEGARELAGEAASAAGEALGEAFAAGQAATDASESAAAAHEMAADSINFAQSAHAEAVAARQELQAFRTELFDLLRADQAEENSDNGVQEVEVNDNAPEEHANAEDSDTSEGGTERPDAGNGQRFGRRVRRGRRG